MNSPQNELIHRLCMLRARSKEFCWNLVLSIGTSTLPLPAETIRKLEMILWPCQGIIAAAHERLFLSTLLDHFTPSCSNSAENIIWESPKGEHDKCSRNRPAAISCNGKLRISIRRSNILWALNGNGDKIIDLQREKTVGPFRMINKYEKAKTRLFQFFCEILRRLAEHALNHSLAAEFSIYLLPRTSCRSDWKWMNTLMNSTLFLSHPSWTIWNLCSSLSLSLF